MNEILLIAASGLAREALTSIHAAGEHKPIGFLDDAEALQHTEIDGLPVRGRLDDVVRYPDAGLVVCMGSGQSREWAVERFKRLGIQSSRYITVVDPSVRVPANCSIGHGSVLLTNVVLTTNVQIGSHVVAMPNVTFTHDNVIEDFATFAAGVSLGGYVRIGHGAYLGMNASVRQRLHVGPRATLGMGAALVRDLPTKQSWVGVPARPVPRIAATK